MLSLQQYFCSFRINPTNSGPRTFLVQNLKCHQILLFIQQKELNTELQDHIKEFFTISNFYEKHSLAGFLEAACLLRILTTMLRRTINPGRVLFSQTQRSPSLEVNGWQSTAFHSHL
jgi:hypothetical protein